MAESMNLITAQITFLASHLVLVHIPNEIFPFFLQPLFRILFSHEHDGYASAVPWTDRHDFLNFSITPVGCSLIASKPLVDKYFRSLAEQFNAFAITGKFKSRSQTVEISSDEYVVIQVEGQGVDAGQRVLELTGPLAMAGISIFFITTYFSDYVLVPVKARNIVVTTLQQRGFVFSEEAEAYVSQLSPILVQQSSPNSQDRPWNAAPLDSDRQRSRSIPVPTTPPAKDIPELQRRTFTKLMKNSIEPIVNSDLRLVNCAGTREGDAKSAAQLKEDLIQVLLATNPSERTSPQSGLSHNDLVGLAVQNVGLDDDMGLSAVYLSLTLSTEPVSLLMEERLLPQFSSTLLASKNEEDILAPIILDLRSLGWQATGIVGGVAGWLCQGTKSFENMDGCEELNPVDISFLSSAKAGSVIVQANQLDKAFQALKLGMAEVQNRQ